jgi:uncharacterized protein
VNLADLIYEKREKVKEICAKHGATAVRVFGSVARGDYGDNSDIDILINLDSRKNEGFSYLGVLEHLHEELETLLGCRVDVIDESGLRDSFREIVLKDAIAL